MDVGSAVLSAELALELLDERLRERVVLCAAPLVEGLIVAAVTASTGATVDQVLIEAEAALAAETAQLRPAPALSSAAASGPTARPAPTQPSGDPAEGLAGSFTVTNPHGLHARPASKIVAEVARLEARALLRNLTTDSEWVPASSLSRVATLGALRGHDIELRV